MESRRRRPSRFLRSQAFQEGASAIAERFRRDPIHQPVDPPFDHYYQRILKGDVAAILEYDEFDVFGHSDGSFYEVVGRLVPLQSFAAAKHMIFEITRRGENKAAPTDYEVYRYWYTALRRFCRIARDFIREEYKGEDEADTALRREQLWRQYIDTWEFRKKGTSTARSLNELRAWVKTWESQHQNAPSLQNQVERFSRCFLVPKVIFFALAESNRQGSNRADRDKRCRSRKFRWTPSYVARKYACAIAGMSSGTVSHRNGRK